MVATKGQSRKILMNLDTAIPMEMSTGMMIWN